MTPLMQQRGTPVGLFSELDSRFCFTLDTVARNGLEQDWHGERVWCNPPWTDIRPWVKKAWAEFACPLVVMLLPANRTEQGWWHELVEPYRDRSGTILRVEFIQGRTRFVAEERPRFGCCLLIWERP